MAAAILRTEDCLRNRFRHGSCSNPKSNNKFSSSRRRKRSPLGFQSNNQRRSEPVVIKSSGRNLVMGQVKILKRGETLIAAAEKTDCGRIHGSRVEEESDLALGSTNRLGPDPITMQKQIMLKEFKIGGYFAGSACFISPPPSSMPVPGLLGRTAMASP